MLYLTNAQLDTIFSILERNNRHGRLLVLNLSLISSRNELGADRLFSPNRYHDSLADVEVVILAVVLAHYPNKSINELLEEIKREYSSCGFFTPKRGHLISFNDFLTGLIDKEFLVYRGNTCFLNMIHLDPLVTHIVMQELVETVEMSVDDHQEHFVMG